MKHVFSLMIAGVLAVAVLAGCPKKQAQDGEVGGIEKEKQKEMMMKVKGGRGGNAQAGGGSSEMMKGQKEMMMKTKMQGGQ